MASSVSTQRDSKQSPPMTLRQTGQESHPNPCKISKLRRCPALWGGHRGESAEDRGVCPPRARGQTLCEINKFAIRPALCVVLRALGGLAVGQLGVGLGSLVDHLRAGDRLRVGRPLAPSLADQGSDERLLLPLATWGTAPPGRQTPWARTPAGPVPGPIAPGVGRPHGAPAEGVEDRSLSPSSAFADAARRPERDRRLDVLVGVTRDLLGTDVAMLTEIHQGREFARRVAGNWPPLISLEGASLPLEDTFCQRLLEGRIGNLVGDVEADERVRDLAMARQLGVGAWLGVPIRPPRPSSTCSAAWPARHDPASASRRFASCAASPNRSAPSSRQPKPTRPYYGARQIVRCNAVLTVFGGVRGIMVV